MMAYNIFPLYALGEAPFYLMFACNAFTPTLFKLLLPKLRYMGDEEMQNVPGCHERINMMAVLSLKVSRKRCPPLTWDPDKAEFKVGNMVLL